MTTNGAAPSPLVGVLGGMGPLATVDFLHKLVSLTPADHDQDHVPTVVWNVPQIPSRPDALAGKGPSPLPAMIAGIDRLNAAGATRIVIPCNTAHTWYDDLQAASLAPIIHIADATVAALPRGLASAGLIATRGTLQSGLYQSRLDARGITPVIPTEDEIDTLFIPGWAAVKSNDLDHAGTVLEAAVRRLLDRGAERVILACTEVPVALQHKRSKHLDVCIDPAIALAHACIGYWQDSRPRPLH